jgi:hypothetical protein
MARARFVPSVGGAMAADANPQQEAAMNPAPSPAPAADNRPKVIRYQLRHSAQVPFAATLPGALTRVVEPDQTEGSTR